MNRTLGDLQVGESGVVVRVKVDGQEFGQRLLEMGFLEGSRVEMLHQAPYSGDPVAVRVRGALIALRRAEARSVEVEVR